MTADEETLIEQFYRENYRMLVKYASCFLTEQDEAEEIVQDAFHTAVEKITQFQASPNRIGWMKLVIKNKIRNLWRAHEQHDKFISSLEETPYEAASPDDPMGTMLIKGKLRAILGEDELSLLWQIAVDRDTYAEAARERGLTVWACQKRVQRSMKKVREHWEDGR